MYDVAVIGAGIVGTAIARELARNDIAIVVIEKTYDIANGATKANSGIVHAGYDAKENTLKARLNVKGSLMYKELCEELEVTYSNNGSLVLAFNDEDIRTIETLYKRGMVNGVKELDVIDREKLLSLEHNVSEKAVGALWAGTAGIVSPYELAIAFAENACQNGCEYRFNTEVISIEKDRNIFKINTNLGQIKSRFIVNAAGIYSDDVNKMLGGEKFRIIPRRGEYCLLDKNQRSLVRSTIFKAPTEKGKGILVTPTVHGNILIGPNAIEMENKFDISTSKEGLEEVIAGAEQNVNGIKTKDIITSFTGIRATPEGRDFIINIPTEGAVNAAGIESPGLTAAPAIAEMVLSMLEDQGLRLNKKSSFISRRTKLKLFNEMSNEEKLSSIKSNPMYGRIICRCEEVTEADIINAIKGPIGAKTVDGVKKRTRPGGGRCQGGFCMPRVVEILARELGVDQKDVLKGDIGSYILTGRTK